MTLVSTMVQAIHVCRARENFKKPAVIFSSCPCFSDIRLTSRARLSAKVLEAICTLNDVLSFPHVFNHELQPVHFTYLLEADPK